MTELDKKEAHYDYYLISVYECFTILLLLISFIGVPKGYGALIYKPTCKLIPFILALGQMFRFFFCYFHTLFYWFLRVIRDHCTQFTQTICIYILRFLSLVSRTIFFPSSVILLFKFEKKEEKNVKNKKKKRKSQTVLYTRRLFFMR